MPAGGTSTTPSQPSAIPSYVVYVTNETSGDLSIIDPLAYTVTTTLPLGKRPRGIKASRDGVRLFVALSGSPPAPPGVDESTLPPPDRSADGIGVVDVASGDAHRRTGRWEPIRSNWRVSLDGSLVFVANEDAGIASVLDTASNQVLSTMPVGGEPEGVTISPDGRVVYVTSEEDNRVSVIDTTELRVVTQFDVGPRPRSSAFSPDGARAYVTSENGGSVAVVDTATHQVLTTIALTGENVRPMGVVVSPDGQRVFVTTGRGGSVIVIDAATNQATASIQVGERPWGIAMSPDGRYLYTANGPSNDVSVVDTETLGVVATIPVGQRPWGVVVVSTGP